MAQARSAAQSPEAARVQVIAPAHLGETAVAALRARGIDARIADAPGDDIVAWAIETPPTATATIELARACARAAAAGRPVCLLVPPPRGHGRAAIERAAALAYLRSHGAALGHDVDAWLEAVVVLVRFGMPKGPHTAVIAPAGSWLEAQANVIVAEAEAAGVRPPHVGKHEEATDVVLYDPALGLPPSHLPGLHLAVIARAELADGDHATLYGARAAIGAIAVLGRAAERIAVGLGPAPAQASAELEINHEQRDRQLAQLAPGRAGDHPTKTLLRAYGAPITRQVVAGTPSAAVNAARRIVFPVEIKPWGNDLPSEPDGCPVERDVTSDALVRRAFAAVLAAAGRTQNDVQAVIVRERPPLGRPLAVSFLKLPALGWTVVLDGPQIAAAPAPLRLVDAQALAAAVVASRADDPEPDRAGLANLLRRVSHLVVDLGDRLVRVELPRVIVGGRGARSVIVDAWCELA
ncbi:MAG: hypothetical protein JWO36_4005 [Myxococcales bacterium]|nr:hypothetical protein [Myxococcales bacterium]